MTSSMSRFLAAAAIAAGISACSGPWVNVAPVPPTSYSEVGPASAEACGMLLFWAIPVSLNDRVERAYREALKTRDATTLTETKLRERWYFAAVGEVICTTIEGTGLRALESDVGAQCAARGELEQRPSREP